MSEVNEEAGSQETNEESAAAETLEETLYGSEEEATEEEATEESQEAETEEKQTEDSEKGDDESEEKSEDKEEKSEEKSEEELELKLSEDSLLQESDVEKMQAFAKENKLSNEQAGKMLKAQEEAVKSFQDRALETHNEQMKNWKKAASEDKEFGGDKFEGNMQIAKNAMTKFFSEDFAKYIEESGYGNYPELIRGFYRVGKAMEGDEAIIGGKTATKEKSVEDIFYGS